MRRCDKRKRRKQKQASAQRIAKEVMDRITGKDCIKWTRNIDINAIPTAYSKCAWED